MIRLITMKTSVRIVKGVKRSLHTSGVLFQGSLTTCSQTDGVLQIILNDPKTRNSLSLAMMDEIQHQITNKINDQKLRCIVLSAGGGNVWSAGHNLKELTPDKGFASHCEVFEKCSKLMLSIHKAPVPIIAKVNGLAAAAACQLVSSCDIVVCSDTSTFSTPGANFGIFCSTPGIAVARVVPRIKASHMLLTGLSISAQDAFISGIVSSVVPEEKLDEEVDKICSAIKNKSRSVIQLGKEFFFKQITMNIEEAYAEGSKVMAHNLSLDDGKEGIMSFVEKRKPKWTN